MVLDRAARGLIEHLFGDDERYVRHHAQVRLQPSELFPHFGLVAKRPRLVNGEAPGERGLLQWIDAASLSWIGGAVDADDVLAAFE